MLKKTEPHGHIKDIIHDSAGHDHRVLCVTPAVSEVKTLDELLGCKVTHTPLMLNAACAVLMHGIGRPARKVMAASTALELPMLYTDFGPLKSFDHKKSHALSMTFDHLGSPMASDRETYLESLIKSDISTSELERIESVIAQWKRAQVSHHNHTLGPALPAQRFVVVFAQPTPLGGDKKESKAVTANLVARATQQFPTHELVVINPQQHAAEALSGADAAFTYSSPVAFEALLWGTPLYVEGMPFYAGWGLTEDSLPAPARRATLEHGLAQLAYAYMVRYTRYVNPFDSQRIEVEQAIELAEKTRPQAVEEANRRAAQRSKLPSWLAWMR